MARPSPFYETARQLYLAGMEEAELLRRRALDMMSAAERHLEEGLLDLSAFLAEQAAQLFLKSVILVKVGEIPRTHSLRELFSVLRRVADPERVDGFVRRFRVGLSRLEAAYLESRYLPRSYAREEVEELVEVAREVIRFAEGL